MDEYLKYNKSSQALGDRRNDLLEQIVKFLNFKYKDAKIETKGDMISVEGSDEDKLAILEELKEIGTI